MMTGNTFSNPDVQVVKAYSLNANSDLHRAWKRVRQLGTNQNF
jgi:hypothetical protein